MAIFRNDQGEFAFAAEAAPGGIIEEGTADVAGGTPMATVIDTTAAVPGDRVIHVTSAANGTVGDYVRIGDPADTENQEIRKVIAIDTASSPDNITVDPPIAFPHPVGEDVDELDITSNLSQTSHLKFTPNIWNSVNLPDPTMEITPHWFLGTAAKRNFYTAYKGRQTYDGSLPAGRLINGFPIRFPLGQVTTTAATTTNTDTLAAAASKGDIEVTLTDVTGYAVNDYIEVGASGEEEVRKIVSVNGSTVGLDYPLLLDHANGAATKEINTSTTYTHTITETVTLDTMSWHALMRASDENASNDWIRQYYGGIVGQATISASEGEWLNMSWDNVSFLGMRHNQINTSASASDVPFSNAAIAKPTVEFPTTEPYYFSQGVITLFGTELARVRSFSINISNNITPYYYITDGAIGRGPSEIREGRRDYTMNASISLPDVVSPTATDRTLFKELLQEGDYGSGMAGFNITLTFTRSSGDTLTITIPDDGAAATGGNEQGAYLRSAKTDLNPADSITSAEVDILFRSMKVVVVDSEPVYP